MLMCVHNINQDVAPVPTKVSTGLLECRYIKSNKTVPSIYKFHGIFHINVITEASVVTKSQYRLLIQINLEFLISYNVYNCIPIKYVIVVGQLESFHILIKDISLCQKSENIMQYKNKAHVYKYSKIAEVRTNYVVFLYILSLIVLS